MNKENILTISWENYINDIHKMIDEFNHLYNNNNNIGYIIIALGRGGLIPGTIMSHKLGYKLFNLGINSYDNNNKIKVYQDFDIEVYSKPIVIVDDLIDSGKTIDYVLEYVINKGIICCIYNKVYNNNINKKKGKNVKLIVSRKINFPCWIKFPYEI